VVILNVAHADAAVAFDAALEHDAWRMLHHVVPCVSSGALQKGSVGD
jgi:hypothetical protein